MENGYTVLHKEILYNENKTESCEIIIPEIVESSIKVKTLGLWLSGGIDSSLLLYLLSKIIQDNKLDIKIQPTSLSFNPMVNDKEKYNFLLNYIEVPNVASRICNAVTKILNSDNILPLITYCPDVSKVPIWKEYDNRWFNNKKTGVWNAIYVGHNANPPEGSLLEKNEYYFKYLWPPALSEPEKTDRNYFWKSRDPNVKRPTVRHDGVTHKPFINVNKKFVASLYKQFDLLHSLLLETKSCARAVKENNFLPCKKCFHCHEKYYGFGVY
tara:strand:- start:117 stop:926 length:810 start_codon:yes stop_codon:yes gene_type:complete